jgi:hypothetical protein
MKKIMIMAGEDRAISMAPRLGDGIWTRQRLFTARQQQADA